MLELRYSTTSPFVRKVSATIIECGLDNHITNVATNPWAPDTDLGEVNPLGKVPALTLDNGLVLFDSPVICEYLDSLGSTPKLFPSDGLARWNALRYQAIGDGIMEAAVGRILESRRPEQQQSTAVASRNQAAVNRALDLLENEVSGLAGDFLIGHLTVACALEYLDFRFDAEDWRANWPNLKAWHDSIKGRPSLTQTVPHD